MNNSLFFQFLGTSAGEQYPGFWCRCENCQKARDKGGKNIRKNSCAYISPNILIDSPPEVFMQAERFGINLVELEYLFITHSHEDHFNLFPFGWRYLDPTIPLPPPHNVICPRFTSLKTLNVIANQFVCQIIEDLIIKRAKYTYKECAMKVHTVEPLKEYQIGDMRIIPLRANHGLHDRVETCLNFIILKEGKTILYALDTGWFFPETYEMIKKFTYDLVVIEGTFGYGIDLEQHFNFKKLEKMRESFEKDKLLKEKSYFCTSHLSPHFSPIYDEIAPVLKEKGIIVAYDGMKLEL